MPIVSTPVDTSWTFAPVAIAAIAAYGVIYGLRWRTVRRTDGARGAPAWRAVLFGIGLLCLLAAIVSPVDRISDQLASGHMVQHLLLADLAAIALIGGFTKAILRPATRRIHVLERKAGPFAHPVFGAVAYIGVMWMWHVPFMYDATLEHEAVHVAEHVTFAGAGFLYWWHLLSPIRSRLRLAGMGPIIYMAATKVLVGFLGVLLGFAPRLLYDGYGTTGERWGMDPLDDQHVAGLIMGLEQSLIMGIALAWLFTRMLGEADRADERAERFA